MNSQNIQVEDTFKQLYKRTELMVLGGVSWRSLSVYVTQRSKSQPPFSAFVSRINTHHGATAEIEIDLTVDDLRQLAANLVEQASYLESLQQAFLLESHTHNTQEQ